MEVLRLGEPGDTLSHSWQFCMAWCGCSLTMCLVASRTTSHLQDDPVALCSCHLQCPFCHDLLALPQ